MAEQDVLGGGWKIWGQPTEEPGGGECPGKLRGDEGESVCVVDAGEGVGEGVGQDDGGVGEGGRGGERVGPGDLSGYGEGDGRAAVASRKRVPVNFAVRRRGSEGAMESYGCECALAGGGGCCPATLYL